MSDPDHWILNAGSRRTQAGVYVNNETALTISTYFACIKIIGETIGHLPKRIYRKRKSGPGRDEVTDHPTLEVLEREANHDMTPMSAFQTQGAHAAGWGNGYAELELDGRGRVRAYYPLPPDTYPEREMDKRGIRYFRTVIDGQPARIPSHRIMHVPGLGYDGYTGYSMIHLMREALGLAKATESFGAKFFGNGAKSGTVIRHPGKLSKEARDNLKEDWADSNEGLENAHKVRLLIEDAQIQQTTIPPEDAQFIATRVFQSRDIARFMRMQLSKLMDYEGFKYASVEHEAILHVVDTMTPWAVRFEQEMTRKFFTSSADRGLYIKFDFDELLRGDSQARANMLKTLVFAGLITRDEGRTRLDLNPKGGAADELMIAKNMDVESDRSQQAKERVADA